MTENLRKSPRLPLDVDVDYKGRAMARSKNISREGICLISEDEPEAGRILNLQFHLPGQEEPVSAYAKVMWVNQPSEHLYEYGLKFWDIDGDDEKKLTAYFSS